MAAARGVILYQQIPGWGRVHSAASNVYVYACRRMLCVGFMFMFELSSLFLAGWFRSHSHSFSFSLCGENSHAQDDDFHKFSTPNPCCWTLGILYTRFTYTHKPLQTEKTAAPENPGSISMKISFSSAGWWGNFSTFPPTRAQLNFSPKKHYVDWIRLGNIIWSVGLAPSDSKGEHTQIFYF